jgi:hypothetical protein
MAGLAHCSVETSTGDRWTAADGLPSSHPIQSSTLGSFEGSFDAASRHLNVVYHWGSGDVHPEAILPYGTKPDQAYFHTISVQWAGTCGAHTLCAQVTAVNNFDAPISNFNVVFDNFSLPDVVAVGEPYAYGTVAAKGSSTVLTWAFNDPSDANFTFRGHAEGTVASLVDAVGVNPTNLNLGTMPMEEIGANGTAGGSLSSNVQNASTLTTSGTIGATLAGAPEIVAGDSPCIGTTLAPLASCVDSYKLDCRTSTGATVGLKRATATVTDSATGTPTTIAISGTCMALIPECETYLSADEACLAAQGDSGDTLASEIAAARAAVYQEAAKDAAQVEATRLLCIQQAANLRDTCF